MVFFLARGAALVRVPQEATIVFDDVFVPAEYVFMSGEVQYAAELVERFTAYHRRSYICKVGRYPPCQSLRTPLSGGAGESVLKHPAPHAVPL